MHGLWASGSVEEFHFKAGGEAQDAGYCGDG
jgi:hypothetical protein